MTIDNSAKVRSLLLTLEQPVKLFLNQEVLPNASLKIADIVTTRPSFPPWPACADILYNSQSRVFVGLSYLVGEKYERMVRDLCHDLSDQVVRYNNFKSEQLRKPYANEDLEYDRVEIVWTDISADKFEVAQLETGFWYYSNDQREEDRVIAFGLTYIDEVLQEYELIFPNSFTLPLFMPEFVIDA